MLLNRNSHKSNQKSLPYSWWILVVLLFSFNLNAQDSKQNNKSILLRGKAFSFFVVEDIFFQNWNIGVEYRFAQKHSIGVDFVHFRWRYEYDIYIDGIETGSGPDAFSRRRYVLVDYRCYPFQFNIKDNLINPYINPFVKVGERKIWTSDPETFYDDKDVPTVKTHRAIFADYGLSLGLRSNFVGYKRFGFDVNIGVVYRETSVRHEQRYDYATDTFSDHYFRKYYNWHPHMRLNLYVKIFNLK